MHLYLYEPRPERFDGLAAELKGERLNPIAIGEDFFLKDLSLLNRAGDSCRPFLLAATEDLADQIAALRGAGCENPILVMRDFRNAREAAASLDLGADEDLVIPIKGIELRARINSILRRSFGHAAESVTVGEVTAFFDGRDPEISGQRLKLSRREHAIFRHLVLNAGRVVSKSAIYDSVYGVADIPPFDKVIDVHICKIRKKFDTLAEDGARYIETFPGRGYKFAADFLAGESAA